MNTVLKSKKTMNGNRLAGNTRWGFTTCFLKGLVFLVCIFTASLFSGCTKFKSFLKSSDPYHTEGYRAIVDKWSREARIHRGMEVQLIASATYQSQEFKQAYIDEYAEAYGLKEDEAAKVPQAHLGHRENTHEFMLATYVPEKKWDEFDKAESMWKLYLVNDGNERVAPLRIKRLQSKDAIAIHFFPYITPWKTVYLVSFPASAGNTKAPIIREDTATIRLVIASVLGSAQMVWNLQ
jgi:hypothetical protein